MTSSQKWTGCLTNHPPFCRCCALPNFLPSTQMSEMHSFQERGQLVCILRILDTFAIFTNWMMFAKTFVLGYSSRYFQKSKLVHGIVLHDPCGM